MDKYMCKNVSLNHQESISRRKLLDWLNSLPGVHVESVESLRSGVVYCRIICNLFPGSILMRNIRKDAVSEHEYILNFRLLQKAFREVNCVKEIPIDKLVKGRYQESLEFLQWVKKFYDANKHARIVIKRDINFVKKKAPKNEEGNKGKFFGMQIVEKALGDTMTTYRCCSSSTVAGVLDAPVDRPGFEFGESKSLTSLIEKTAAIDIKAEEKFERMVELKPKESDEDVDMKDTSG